MVPTDPPRGIVLTNPIIAFVKLLQTAGCAKPGRQKGTNVTRTKTRNLRTEVAEL